MLQCIPLSGKKIKRAMILITAGLCLFSVLCMQSGCEKIARDAQFTSAGSGLLPMNMELKLGEGKTDAASLIKKHKYEGSIRNGGLTVYYPSGMKLLAKETVSAFVDARISVNARTGITWSFNPTIYLVPINSTNGGFRLKIPVRRDRNMELPLLVKRTSGRYYVWLPWSQGIGHELTEASMLSSLEKKRLILGDYSALGVELVNETRWFRDGVSEYAGDILNEKLTRGRYVPPSGIYSDLERVGERLLRWYNPEDKTGDLIYYSAARGLVYELVSRAGPNTIADIIKHASESDYINGTTLCDSVKKVTGIDLHEFLAEYRAPWLGIEVRDTTSLAARQSKHIFSNKVLITYVYPHSPAEKWKLHPGDVIISVDGKRITSAAGFVHALAGYHEDGRLLVEIERDGHRKVYRVKLMYGTPSVMK